jgi:hypothetical protein
LKRVFWRKKKLFSIQISEYILWIFWWIWTRKTSVNTFRNFCSRVKSEYWGIKIKKSHWGGGEENFPCAIDWCNAVCAGPATLVWYLVWGCWASLLVGFALSHNHNSQLNFANPLSCSKVSKNFIFILISSLKVTF